MISFAREALYDLVAEYGPGLGADPSRLEQLLRERCPECPQEVFVLVQAARLGIPARLETLVHTPASPAFLPVQVRQLAQSSGLTEGAATWGVQTWGMALGVLAEPSAPSSYAPTPGLEATAIRVGPPPPTAVAASPSPPPPASRRPPTWLLAGLAALVIMVGGGLGVAYALRDGNPSPSSTTLSAASSQRQSDVPLVPGATTTTTLPPASTTVSTAPPTTVPPTTLPPTTTTTAPLVLLSSPQEMTCTSYGAVVIIPAGWAPLGIQKDQQKEISRLEVNHPDGSFFVCQTEDGPYWSAGFDAMAYQRGVEKSNKAEYPDLVTEVIEPTTFAGVSAARWTYTRLREGIPTRYFSVAFRLRADLPPTVLAYRHPDSASSETKAELAAIVASFRVL